MELNKIYQEPCLETLSKMPNEFLDCVITSPPYWQLRDYGYDGQWGLEPTYQEYLENLWSMMDEIYRVLKPSGSVWVNLGDTYSTQSGTNAALAKGKNYEFDSTYLINRGKSEKLIKPKNLPNKCLLLIPHRFAIGCIDRGWIVRNDIIWAKRNGMPESVIDRFTKKHEYFFFMVKNEKYYFDLDSVRDKIKSELLERYKYEFSGNKGGVGREMIGEPSGKKYSSIIHEATHRQGMHELRGTNLIFKRNNLPTHERLVNFFRNKSSILEISEKCNIPKTKVEHWFRKDDEGFSYPSIEDWKIIRSHLDDGSEEFKYINESLSKYEIENDDINKNNYKGKNPSDVSDFWDITTKGTSAQHYASYNDELIKKPILAGCPEGGIIYDPFMGTGSTAEAALRANRKFIGSEMSEKYVEIANERLSPFLTQLNLF